MPQAALTPASLSLALAIKTREVVMTEPHLLAASDCNVSAKLEEAI